MNSIPSPRRELILITDISPSLCGSGSQHLKDIARCLSEYSRLRIFQVNAVSPDHHCSKSTLDYNHFSEVFSSETHITLHTLFEDTVFSDEQQTAYLHRIRINAHKFFYDFDRKMASVMSHSIVVIFVQWPGMIFLWEAFAFSKWLTVPILMDRFEPLFIAYPLSKSARSLIRDSFNVALHLSDGLLTGSKKAANSLSKIFQVPCREIISTFREISAPNLIYCNNGLGISRWLKTHHKLLKEIALAGQIYARDSVEIFLSALEQLNTLSNDDSSKYSLNYYGDYPIHNMFTHGCIAAHGSFEYENLLPVLGATCSYGLVPYSFDELFASSAEFSFPSKLVAYIQAGLIPIYVGPKNSSVFDLLDEYGLTELCITGNSVCLVGEQLATIFLSDADVIWTKLFNLSHLFSPRYLQDCINSVFDQLP